jgi:hypothetical protein
VADERRKLQRQVQYADAVRNLLEHRGWQVLEEEVLEPLEEQGKLDPSRLVGLSTAEQQQEIGRALGVKETLKTLESEIRTLQQRGDKAQEKLDKVQKRRN